MGDRFLDEIIEMSREAEDAHLELLAAKETAKVAKDKWDGLMEAIMARLRRRREEGSDPDRLPFGDDIEVKVADEDTVDVDSERTALPRPLVEADEPDDWRAVPTSDLSIYGLSERTVEKLEESGLTTVGAIADWSNAGKELTDVPGIGHVAATSIERALDEFWAARKGRKAS